MRVGVLMGGTSAEREVSLNSGKAVSSALRAEGYDVVDIDAGRDVASVLFKEKVEVAFVALHGGVGEDGSIQGLLEVMGMPYTGSGVMASAIAMDKVMTKIVFSHAGIKVPGYRVLSGKGGGIEGQLTLPVVVKPSREGSSVGVSIVRDRSGLGEAVERAASYGGPVIVEEYIKGKEVQIGILDGRVLGGVEVRPSLEFYSYEAKYTLGMTEYILPPELDERTYRLACDAALSAHMSIGCEGATRVDLLVDGRGEVYALEVNTIPGMTRTSLLPKIAEKAGMDFQSLIREMLNGALARRRRK